MERGMKAIRRVRRGRGVRGTLGVRLAALLAGAGVPVMVLGQSQVQGEAVLQTVTVTAEKRSATPEAVPASLAVTQGEALARQRTRRRDDAIGELPNVHTGAVTARLYTSFMAIRGVGSALIESDPAVGLYLDGIGVGSTQAHSGTLLDVDRIEVLRGPQGTLYGRNNIAGSVNVLSRRPDPHQRGGEIELDYARYDSVTGTGVFNTPLGAGGWAARAALSASKRGSPFSSTVDGDALGTGHNAHGRFSVAGDVGEATAFLGIVDVERQVLDGEMFGMPEADFRAGRHGVAIDEASRIESDLASVSAQFTHRLANGDSVVAQTGYQRSRARVSGNGFPLGYYAMYDGLFQSFGLPGFRYRSDNPYDGDYRQWSQELRYVSDQQARFDWVAGLYGEHSEATREYGAGSRFTGGEATLASRGKTRTMSLSVFADGSYWLDERWKLFGGVRIGRDRKSFDYAFQANDTAAALGLASTFAPGYGDDLAKTYATPRLGAQLTVNDAVNVYASVSAGYKSGGFNAGFVGLGDEGAYDDERLVSYEVGMKALTASKRLGVDAALFYIDWRDQQVQGYNALTGATPLMNAPRSRSFGGEVSARLQLDHHWRVHAGLGYTDASYRDFHNARALDGSGQVDVSGHRQQFVSRFTGSAGVDYEWATGWSDLTGKLGASYQFRSAYYFDVQNTQRQPAYGLLNLYAGVENARYATYVYARNVGDKRYRVIAGDLGGGTLVNAGDPLTVGVSFKLKF